MGLKEVTGSYMALEGVARGYKTLGLFFFTISALLSTERLQTHLFTTITKIFVQ